MSPESNQRRSLLAPAVALVVILVLAGGVVTLLGSQVSGVLSTVGASVGGPGTVGAGGGTTGDGTTGDEQPGSGEGAGGNAGGAGSGSGGDSDGSSGDGAAPPLLDVAHPELLVIKTGAITIQVGDIDATVSAATRAIDGLGGYVSGSSRSGGTDDPAAAITFRIPAAAWDRALVALRGLGGTILDEHSETDDVTGQVVDLDAHVRNLQTTEAALAAIMAKATTIKDVLTVQQELTDVRGQIEELQSQASHLREQAAFSTLELNVRRTPAPVVARQEGKFDPGTEADAAVAHLVGVGQALAKVGIWIGIVWLPLLLAAGIGGGIALFLYRQVRRATAPA